MNVPLYGDENHELVEDIFDQGQKPPDFDSDEHRDTYDHERRLWKAQRGLKDVYLECGWLWRPKSKLHSGVMNS